MRILIAFYSKTGGTEKVSHALEQEFKGRGHLVEVEKIIPQKEHSSWVWWWLRLFKRDCNIQALKIKDASRFDLICVGSPNWSCLSLPVARYLKLINGLKHKNIGFFSTAFLPPAADRYFLSAYLLNTTFSWQVARREGRMIDSLLLSSFFKKWDVDSEKGKKLIKSFCDKLETPFSSLKKYFLERKEIENTRFLVVLFSFILLLSFAFQLISIPLGWGILSWLEFFIIFAVEIFIYLIILAILTSQSFIFLGKYLAGLALVFGATVAIMFLLPALGRTIVLSYALILVIFIFFRNPRTISFVGMVIFLSYYYLHYAYPLGGVLMPSTDLSFILLNIIIIWFIAKNMQDRFFNLLDVQEEIETARAVLEIKVEARTRELKELSASLEDQVAERTFSLQEKIEDLERFNRLTVGRELKMIELKEEIGELKKIRKK